MSRLLGLRHILRTLFARARADAETREELAFHLERQTQKHIDSGMSPDDAARLAAIELGGAERWREETAAARRGAWMHDMNGDVRYAIRGLLSRPGFTLSALATVAIGVGANVAIIALAHGALLRPLPFPDSDRLMTVALRMPRSTTEVVDMVWSYPKFAMLRDRQNVFASMALHSSETVVVGSESGAERMSAETASASYFPMLGARPQMGRTFSPDEDAFGGPSAIVVLSDDFWHARFAGRNVLGESITINGRPHTIIGVTQPGFRGLSGDARFWIPIPDARSIDAMRQPTAHNLELVAKLRDGVSPAAARASVKALGREIDRVYPSDNGQWGAAAYALDDLRVNGTIRRSIRLLVIAVALLFAIVLVNTTTLALTRNAAREREFAVRVALGAGRMRVARQLFTEAVVLVVAGSALGLAIAWGALRVLVATLPLSSPTATSGTDLTRLVFSDLGIDSAALAATVVLVAVIVFVVGATTLAVFERRDAFLSLRQGASSDGPARRFAGGNALVVLQTALALTFLVAAGLTTQSLVHALSIPLGYQPSGLLTLKMTLDPARAGRDSNPQLWSTILDEVRAVPGVRVVAVGSCSPLGMHCDGTSITPAGHATAGHVMYLQASPDYFSALRTSVVRGRVFSPEDMAFHRPVAIVNRAAARSIWGSDDPMTTPLRNGDQTIEIVGIVDDARYSDIEHSAEPAVFFPHSGSRGVLFVRTDGDPSSIGPAVRAAIRRAGAGHAVGDMRTMEGRLADAMAKNRLVLQVFLGFGLSALVLAAIGVYGALALRVALRRRELAIRRALGASATSLAGTVGRQATSIAIAGGALGLAVAAILARLLSSLLYDVRPFDVGVYVAAAGLLLVTIALAAAIPTMRSIRADPRDAMRAE